MSTNLSERRVSPRCNAVTNRSVIELAAPDGLQRIGASLVNISRHGALVVTDKPMLRTESLSFRIDKPVRTDWAKADVAWFGGNRQIGLRFAQECTGDLLLAGTVGIDLALLIRHEINGTTACD